MPGEALALNLANKINNELKFLHRENSFLAPALKHLLCYDLMQPHLDCACSA